MKEIEELLVSDFTRIIRPLAKNKTLLVPNPMQVKWPDIDDGCEFIQQYHGLSIDNDVKNLIDAVLESLPIQKYEKVFETFICLDKQKMLSYSSNTESDEYPIALNKRYYRVVDIWVAFLLSHSLIESGIPITVNLYAKMSVSYLKQLRSLYVNLLVKYSKLLRKSLLNT